MDKGIVYLIGAGPGDPSLITVKGKTCIEEADVVIYDFLASPALLAYARKDAELIYVGKKGGDHTLSQEKINDLIVEKAGSNRVVVRLKGGDPFIFGRGGEEAEVLEENSIPFEIVPGVTSAIAAPAYAGIPLTHRTFTSTVAFVTGHEDPTKTESSIDWASLAKGVGTIVFLMGIKNLENIVRQLMENGKPPDTPVALVRWGTTSEQKTLVGTLENISARAKEAALRPPAIIVVGNVVSLRDKLTWFENKPLFGKRIVVTRAREQASGFVKTLAGYGAECIECPTIEISPPDDYTALDTAIENIVEYDWLIFTSVNGVKFFFQRLFAKGKDVRILGNIRTAAIGPATAEALAGYGITTDIVPENYRAESVVDAFRSETVIGKKILLPRAREARPILPVELEKMGAKVDEIEAYYTKISRVNEDLLISGLEDASIDMITFTSSSTVKNFMAMLPADEKEWKALMKNVVTACIGPITADTAKELGLDVHIVADEYTISGLCKAVLDYFNK